MWWLIIAIHNEVEQELHVRILTVQTNVVAHSHASYSADQELQHREITLIELQSLVVFGCAALLFMVGATASTHDREEGWDDFLFVYTE